MQMIPSFFQGILSDCVNTEHLWYTSDSSALTRKGFQRRRVCERYKYVGILLPGPSRGRTLRLSMEKTTVRLEITRRTYHSDVGSL